MSKIGFGIIQRLPVQSIMSNFNLLLAARLVGASSLLLIAPFSALATELVVPDATFSSRVVAISCCVSVSDGGQQDGISSGPGALTAETRDDASFAAITLDYSSKSGPPFGLIEAEILVRTGGYIDDEFGDRHYLSVGASAFGTVVSYMEIFDTNNPATRPVDVNVISKLSEIFSGGGVIAFDQSASWGLRMAPKDDLSNIILSLGDTVTNINYISTGAHIIDTDADVIFQTNTLYVITLNLEFGGGVVGGPYSPGEGVLEIGGFVDPRFELVTPEPGLELVLSRGLGSGSAIPEPSTWAMMLMGFVGLGFTAYRRTSPKNA